MSVEPNCPDCGGELQASWKVCPYCGAAIVTDVPANVASPPVRWLDGPLAKPDKISPETEIWYAEAQREGRNDLAFVGIGLIVLAVLGFVGGISVIFSGSLHDLGTFEVVTTGILFGGGVLVAMVIGGTTLIAASGKSSPAQNAATSIMGGLLASFMFFGLVGLTILAAFIYAVEDCLNGCN